MCNLGCAETYSTASSGHVTLQLMSIIQHHKVIETFCQYIDDLTLYDINGRIS